jgi:hypothetical protein
MYAPGVYFGMLGTMPAPRRIRKAVRQRSDKIVKEPSTQMDTGAMWNKESKDSSCCPGKILRPYNIVQKAWRVFNAFS